MLGIQPLMGRLYVPDDFRPGARGAVIISYSLWERRFGRSADVLGRELMINGQARTIVGVMPGGVPSSIGTSHSGRPGSLTPRKAAGAKRE